jgi:hypothetical protein
MSMFFFRLHNLQREEANKQKKKVIQQKHQQQQRQRQRRGAKVFRASVTTPTTSVNHLTVGPSRLFEKTPMSPSDSLDEIALQIPRFVNDF